MDRPTRLIPRHVLILSTAYLVLAILPLGLALLGDQPRPRGVLIELAIGLGFAGLAMMGLQFILIGRFRSVAGPLGLDDLMRAHRLAGITAAIFLLAHPALLILVRPRYATFFDPRVNLPRAFTLSLVVIVVVLLVALPLARQKLKLKYEWWRVTHGLLAGLALLIGLAHVLVVSRYVSAPWQKAVWIIMTTGPLALLAYTQIARPLILRQRPWRVTDVRTERDNVWTVTLTAENHDGLRFEPGQFAWVRFGDRALSPCEHPFTIASSAEQRHQLAFTIKALGDFTSRIGTLPIGTRAVVEGPYGHLTTSRSDARRLVLVAGGIGITPMMSILRTMRDRHDRRPTTLIYGCETLEKVIFRAELEQLRSALNLDLVYVLEHPPAPPQRWEGETGLVTAELLERVLSRRAEDEAVQNGNSDNADSEHRRRDDTHYFICGPTPMMNVVERYCDERRVPLACVHSEHFTIV